MAKKDDVVKELELLCVDLSDELARAEEALVLLTGKGKKKASASVPAGLQRQELVCDECGREFDTPQGLGAHKQRVHGLGGDSKRTQSRRRAERIPVRQTTIETMRKLDRPVSVRELAESIGASKKSVSTAIAFFKKGGLVRDAGVDRATGGGKRPLYALVPEREAAPQRSLIESLAPDMSGENQQESVTREENDELLRAAKELGIDNREGVPDESQAS